MITTILIIGFLIVFRIGISVGEFLSLGRKAPPPASKLPPVVIPTTAMTAGAAIAVGTVKAVAILAPDDDVAGRRKARLKEVQHRVGALSAEPSTRRTVQVAEADLGNLLPEPEEVLDAEVLSIEEEMALHDLVLAMEPDDA